MKSFVGRYQISIFFALTFVISWFPWYAGIAPEVLAWGPSVAAFIVVAYIGGKRGLLDFLRPFGHWHVGFKFWGIAIFGPAFLFLIGLGVYLLLGGEAPPFTMIRTELHLIPLYLVLVVLMPWNGPVGEEFSWRGFALPKLQPICPADCQPRHRHRVGCMASPRILRSVGRAWALASSMGVVSFMLVYTLGTIANSVYMTWLYNKTGADALVAGIVWHAAIEFRAPPLLSDSSLVAAGEGTHLPTIAQPLY